MDDGSEGVWRALASPHRRRLLDLLRDGPRATGELAASFDDLSRFAVMQHLGVLVDAGLVTVRREGKRRLNHLNAVPLREAYERWVSRFAGEAAAGVVALRRHVEGGRDMTDARAIKIANEIRLKATPDRVWRAYTAEQADWYPHSYGRDRVKSIVFEPRVGGRMYEDWGGESGYLYGTVVHHDPPQMLGTRGHLRGGITLEQWVALEAVGDETILRYDMTTFGPIDDEMAEAIRYHGDLSRYEDALRGWVEGGDPTS